LQQMGPDTARFRDATPGKDLWIVQQAFKWSTIQSETTNDPGDVYPTLDEYRFMAWQAVLNGATGLLWWGSRFEDRPASFLDDLMQTVSEIHHVAHLMATGPITRVTVMPDVSLRAPILGPSCTARRLGDHTLFVLVNEDSCECDVSIQGMDWLAASELTPLHAPKWDLVDRDGTIVTALEAFETRVYVAG
jgi:hypothetical protein